MSELGTAGTETSAVARNRTRDSKFWSPTN